MYRDFDVASEIVARMDGHRESEGTEFVVPGGIDENASMTEFELIAERGGKRYVFTVQVRAMGEESGQ